MADITNDPGVDASAALSPAASPEEKRRALRQPDVPEQVFRMFVWHAANGAGWAVSACLGMAENPALPPSIASRLADVVAGHWADSREWRPVVSALLGRDDITDEARDALVSARL